MGGRASRNKGARGERSLVEYLKSRGYDAQRVPLSGAMRGYKHDVTATREGRVSTFELKWRKNEYKTVYALYDKLRGKDDVVGVRVGETSMLLFSDFGSNEARTLVATDVEHLGLTPKELKTLGKVVNMFKLKQGADFLVLKGDYFDFLFVRYF